MKLFNEMIDQMHFALNHKTTRSYEMFKHYIDPRIVFNNIKRFDIQKYTQIKGDSILI